MFRAWKTALCSTYYLEIHALVAEMAFPGMGGMGMGGRQAMDPQQAQEQQMIKYVSQYSINYMRLPR